MSSNPQDGRFLFLKILGNWCNMAIFGTSLMIRWRKSMLVAVMKSTLSWNTHESESELFQYVHIHVVTHDLLAFHSSMLHTPHYFFSISRVSLVTITTHFFNAHFLHLTVSHSSLQTGSLLYAFYFYLLTSHSFLIPQPSVSSLLIPHFITVPTLHFPCPFSIVLFSLFTGHSPLLTPHGFTLLIAQSSLLNSHHLLLTPHFTQLTSSSFSLFTPHFSLLTLHC